MSSQSSPPKAFHLLLPPPPNPKSNASSKTQKKTEAGCSTLYRLNVARPHKISIKIAPLSDASDVDYAVALLSHDLSPHTESHSDSRASQHITKHLEAGLYSVHVRNLFARNEPLRFEIRATVGNRAGPLDVAPATVQNVPASQASPSIVERPEPRPPAFIGARAGDSSEKNRKSLTSTAAAAGRESWEISAETSRRNAGRSLFERVVALIPVAAALNDHRPPPPEPVAQ